ncbi:uncharacterized protein LOC142234243 [Haematobia irritans]|uniref:uncharacterized protein LOC142234243 n=1 Tax=Haematobia irritans TaxID=7368 RepID=UPI003F506DEC
MMAVLKQLVNKNINVGPPIDFPVKSFEDMEAVNLKIADDVEKYVAIIRTICHPGGIYTNFDRMFSMPIILAYNYDGINNKRPFKELKALYSAIYDAVKTEGYTEKDYIADIRKSFKKFKGRHFRKVCVEKNKNVMNKYIRVIITVSPSI